MLTTKNNQKGFTIVELLIVIVVIGILAALVINTFSGVQRKARNSERQTDIKALQSQLEAKYTDNLNYYYSDNDINTTNLQGLDSAALTSPQAGGITYVANQNGAGTVNYYYWAVQADGATACDDAGEQCGEYCLYANLEGGGKFAKKSLNVTTPDPIGANCS